MSELDNLLRKFWKVIRVYVYLLVGICVMVAIMWALYQGFLAILGDVAHTIKNS